MSEGKIEQIDCPQVEFSAGVAGVGVFANAFRVVRDTGDEFLLDFVVYSAVEKKAVVMARIRVSKTLLPAMQRRMEQVLAELANPPPTLSLVVPHKDGDGVN